MKKSLGAKTLAYPAPVWVIGTYDKAGKPNVMTASWAGICCSEPPCAAVALRKATYTYGNIVNREAFTINVAPESYVKQADYFGIVSGAREDKFAKTGFTPVKAEHVDAPYVDEFPLILECRLIHSIEIGLHTQFIGQIMDVKADEEVLGEEGNPEMDKVRPVIFGPGIRKYYGLGEFLGKGFTIGKEI